jgi:hypothetical protein
MQTTEALRGARQSKLERRHRRRKRFSIVRHFVSETARAVKGKAYPFGSGDPAFQWNTIRWAAKPSKVWKAAIGVLLRLKRKTNSSR